MIKSKETFNNVQLTKFNNNIINFIRKVMLFT